MDAPIFDFDGVTGLDSSYVAELIVGNSLDTLAAVPDTVSFLDGTNAGYLPYEGAQERFISPSPVIEERIWFKLLIYRYSWSAPFGKLLGVGESRTYSMVVTNAVMPMIGLESLKLDPEQLQISRQADQVILRWQYLAASRYELQSASSLVPSIVWSPIFEWSGVGDNGQIFSVTNEVTAIPQFYRLERWR